MQMYRVKFARKLTGDVVDLGDTLVCAQSQEAAGMMVSQALDISLSETEMIITRVKPSFYQISRREVKSSMPAVDASAIDAQLACSATFPGVTENMPDEVWFSIEARANIRGENENDAITKLSKAILKDILGEKQKGYCRDFDVLCDRTDLHPRSPAVEQNALYAFRRIFQGGDTRT